MPVTPDGGRDAAPTPLAAPASPARRLAQAAALVAAAALTVWFFSAEDARGKLARFEADAPYYYVYLVSLVYDGDLDFADEYAVTHNWYRFGEAPTGRPKNVFGIGPGLFTAPFFFIGHVIARLAGLQPDGFSAPEIRASAFASLAYSLGAVAFALRLCRRRLNEAPAWAGPAGPVLAFFGSSAIFYALRQPGYAHPFAAFFTAWLVDHWDASFARAREEPAAAAPRTRLWWLTAGLLVGATALARPQLAPWGLVLLAALFDDRRRGIPARALAARLGLCALAGFIVFSPQLVAWKVIFGAFYLVPQGPFFMRWDAPAWSEVLFSSRNGLFAWTPICALAVIGLLLALRRERRLAGWLLVGFAIQVIANGAVWDWWGGGSYGARRFDSAFIAFSFGLTALFRFIAAIAPRRRAGRAADRVRAGLRGAAFAAALLLALGNLSLAGRIVAPPDSHGEPAFMTLRRRMPPLLGDVAQWFSFWATTPARLAFRLRHGTGLWGYDRITGVYFLGESYPGLNSFRPATEQAVALDGPRPYLFGFSFEGTTARLAAGRARILVPLNRRHGPLDLRLDLVPAAAGPVVVRWNGDEVARAAPPARQAAQLPAELRALRRGVNVLEIEAPAGTSVPRFWLGARPGALP